MRVFELALIFFLLFCVLDVTNGKRGKALKGKMSNMGKKPSRNKKGQVSFMNEMSITVDIEGVETSTMALKRANIKVPSKRPSKKNSKVAAYVNEKESAFCIEMCDDEAVFKCEARCKMETTEGLYYLTGNGVLYLESNDGIIDSVLNQNGMEVSADGKVKVKAKKGEKMSHNSNKIKQVQQNMAARLSKVKAAKSASRRDMAQNVNDQKRETTSQKIIERRALLPDVESDMLGIVKLLFVVDLGFIERMQDLVGSDVNATIAESEKFVTLIVNEMTLHSSSLADYNESFTLNGISHPLNMAVYLQNLILPPLNAAGTGFDNFDWSEDHVWYKDFGSSSEKGLFAVHYYYYNQYWYSEYPLYSFGTWLKNSQLTGYDVAHAISGYDLGELSLQYWYGRWYYLDEDTNVIGRAFVNTACKTQTQSFATRTGVAELFSRGLSRVLSHEVGHNFGSPHDQAPLTCPEGKNIMSPYAMTPSDATPDFNKFSSCSASSIASYLTSITPSQFEECLYNNKPNNTEFRENFCQGATGNDYSLTEQCKIHLEDSSAVVCPNGMSGISDGFVPFGGCVVNSTNPLPLLYCGGGGSCSGSNLASVNTVWMGTPCLNQDGSQGDRVCFNAECSAPVDFC